MNRSLAIFAAVVSAVTMSQFMRAAISVVGPDVMADAQLSPEAYGSVAGAFFLGIAAAQIPTGLLFDRIGARATIAGMQVLAALGTFGFALADGLVPLFAGRFVTGVGFASALMGGLVVAARWYPPDRFSQVAGLFIACSAAIGLLAAATPMAWLSGALGWRAAFMIAGACTLATGAVVWLVVRDAPPGHPWHTRKHETLANMLRGYATIVRLPGMLHVMLMAGVGYPTLITIVGVWGGPYLHDVHGLGGIARGNVLSFMVAGSVTGLLLYGPLDRWVDSRKAVVLGGVALSATILGTLAMVNAPPVWVVAALFMLYGICGSYYVTNIALGRAYYPDHLVGRGVTTVNLCTFIGVIVLQFAAAMLMGRFGADAPGASVPEVAYRVLFGALAAFALVVGLLYLRARDVKPSAERARAKGVKTRA